MEHYVNGANTASNNYGKNASNYGNNNAILIGSNNANPSYSGALDDVRIYNITLSPAEIQFLYESYF